MKATFARAWRFVRWPLGVIFVLYVGLVIYRIPAVMDKQKTAEAVAQITAQKITLSDVMGAALPPTPNEQENNSSVAGIDKNGNGIRDDVELAIFKEYPNSTKIRAAELQYAMALQSEAADVFNKDTWVAGAIQDDRGYQCIGELHSRTNLNEALSVLSMRSKEVKNLVFNTSMRRSIYEKNSNFTTSFGPPDTYFCDIDLNTLPN